MYPTFHFNRTGAFGHRSSLAFLVMLLAIGGALASRPALADTSTINFEGYTLGTVNGQDGWVSTGAAGSGCGAYDHAVVANTYGYAAFGTQSLRIPTPSPAAASVIKPSAKRWWMRPARQRRPATAIPVARASPCSRPSGISPRPCPALSSLASPLSPARIAAMARA